MADFKDTFNRADSAAVGNGWKFKNKTETNQAAPWQIQTNRALPNPPTSLSTIMYRPSPVAAGSDYQVIWTFGANAGSYTDSELCFRYTATGGRGNARFAIILVGTSGSLRQRSNAADGSTIETTVGSWTRVSDNDYIITVNVTSDDIITIYDTNFTGTDNLALTLTSTYNRAETGIGMGSGSIDQFEINDIEKLAATDFDLSPIRCRISVDMRVEVADPAAGDFPDAKEHYAGIAVSPYVVLDGIPQAVSGAVTLGTALTLGTVTVSNAGALLDPSTVATGADQRWLPVASSFHDAAWFPLVASSFSWARPVPTDPLQLDTYIYSAPTGPATVKAASFNRAGYMVLSGHDGVDTSWSVAVAGVFHNGQGPSYAFIETAQDSGAQGAPLALTYDHGRISVRGAGEAVGHETQKIASGPAVVILSVDGPNNLATLLIQDKQRVTRTFSLTGIDTRPGLYFGADMSIFDQFNANTAADMDVFEIDRWDRPLALKEMLAFISVMSACYGVGQ